MIQNKTPAIMRPKIIAPFDLNSEMKVENGLSPSNSEPPAAISGETTIQYNANRTKKLRNLYFFQNSFALFDAASVTFPMVL